ncbi:MAG: methyltransferase domain-containing protein [Leptospiraceae bacterium]|nr:methyltransferase domain-containing protein [Leptospiraceae bacterium]
MQGRTYYEDPEYLRYLLSRERHEIFSIQRILDPIDWQSVENLLDFGMGPGFFSAALLKRLPKDAWLWGSECQETLIDRMLKRRTDEGLERITLFHTERTEHPLLPDWIPDPDIIFCSCVMSTFADPSLAISGIGRKLKNDGYMYLLDWERIESPAGPPLVARVSSKRMQYSIEEAGFEVYNEIELNEWLYYYQLRKTERAIEEKNRFSHLDY